MPVAWFRHRDSIKEGHYDPVGVYVLCRGLEEAMKYQSELLVAEGWSSHGGLEWRLR